MWTAPFRFTLTRTESLCGVELLEFLVAAVLAEERDAGGEDRPRS